MGVNAKFIPLFPDGNHGWYVTEPKAYLYYDSGTYLFSGCNLHYSWSINDDIVGIRILPYENSGDLISSGDYMVNAFQSRWQTIPDCGSYVSSEAGYFSSGGTITPSGDRPLDAVLVGGSTRTGRDKYEDDFHKFPGYTFRGLRASAATTNLLAGLSGGIQNTTFEGSGFGGWIFPGTPTIQEISSAWATHGNKSLHIAYGSDPGSPIYLNLTSITSNAQYTAQFMAKVVSGGVKIGLAGDVSGATWGNTITSEGLSVITKTFSSDNNRYLYVQPTAFPCEFYLDSVMLTSGSSILPFVPQEATASSANFPTPHNPGEAITGLLFVWQPASTLNLSKTFMSCIANNSGWKLETLDNRISFGFSNGIAGKCRFFNSTIGMGFHVLAFSRLQKSGEVELRLSVDGVSADSDGVLYGSGNNQFYYPYDVITDGTYLYVADTYNNRIVKRLCSDLSYVAKIGSQGSGNDQFYYPSGITTDGTYLYVADMYNHRIVKRLCSDLSYVAKIGSYGSGNDQFYYPSGIIPYGTYLYIADTNNHRIVKRLCSDLSYVSKSPIATTLESSLPQMINLPNSANALILPIIFRGYAASQEELNQLSNINNYIGKDPYQVINEKLQLFKGKKKFWYMGTIKNLSFNMKRSGNYLINEAVNKGRSNSKGTITGGSTRIGEEKWQDDYPKFPNLNLNAFRVSAATINLLAGLSGGIDNTTFENGTVGNWVGIRTNLNVVGGGLHGTKNLRAIVLEESGYKYLVINVLSITNDNTAYTFYAFVKAANDLALNCRARSSIYDYAPDYAGSVGQAITITNNWQMLPPATFTMRSGRTTANAAIFFYASDGSSSPPAGAAFDVDCAILVQGSNPLPFIPQEATACHATFPPPISPGEDFTIIYLCWNPWAANDGVNHYLFSTNNQLSNVILAFKYTDNNFNFAFADANGNIRYFKSSYGNYSWNQGFNVFAASMAGTTMRMSFNGQTPITYYSGPVISRESQTQNFKVGISYSEAYHFNGLILPIILRGYAASQEELNYITGLINNPSLLMEYINNLTTVKNSNLICFDNTSPLLAGFSPSTVKWRDKIEICASGTDNESGYNKFDIYVDGQYKTFVESGSSYYLDTKEYADGYREVGYTLYDIAGNTSGTSVNVLFDNTAPYIDITYLPEYVSGTSIAISGTAYDEYSNISKVEYQLYRADNPNYSWTVINGSSGSSPVSWSFVKTNLTNGQYIVKFRATDELGNVTPSGDYLVKTFTVKQEV